MKKGKLGKVVALGAVVGAGAWIYKKYDTIKSMYHRVSLFKGERYDFDEFDGEAVAAMFSGITIDLSDAEFSEDEVYLDIYSFCSGIRILIPKDVEVVLEGTNSASGIHLDQDDEVEKVRTLFVNYNAIASGILVTDEEDGCCEDDCDCEDDCECDDECNCEDDCACNEDTDEEVSIAEDDSESEAFEAEEETEE